MPGSLYGMRLIDKGTVGEVNARVGGLRLEGTLPHPAAAFAAMTALEEMSGDPPHADGVLVTVTVQEREGAIMEAARRLSRAGVGADDLVLSHQTPIARYG